MDTVSHHDEWRVLQTFLPEGWEERARWLGAFRRARSLDSPGPLLRVLLFHAVNDGGLKTTVARASAGNIVSMSSVALFKRLRSAGPWLRWLATELCAGVRSEPTIPVGLRPRAVDATTVQGPGAKTSQWLLHYSFDLLTLGCDWHELTPGNDAELLERVPVRQGDVLIADRAYFRADGVRATVKAGGHVLVRMRWRHPHLVDCSGAPVRALSLVPNLRVGEVGEWPVWIPGDGDRETIGGRVVALKLPEDIAEKARKRLRRMASKKQHKLEPKSLEAAGYVMLFTTIPSALIPPTTVAELYRHRWQVELVFKRHKQLLRLGRLPHKDTKAAQSWILAKLVVAFLLETIYRRSLFFSPWGYDVSALAK